MSREVCLQFDVFSKTVLQHTHSLCALNQYRQGEKHVTTTRARTRKSSQGASRYLSEKAVVARFHVYLFGSCAFILQLLRHPHCQVSISRSPCREPFFSRVNATFCLPLCFVLVCRIATTAKDRVTETTATRVAEVGRNPTGRGWKEDLP